MADVVRLSIVYDTGQAASKLGQLDELLGALQANTNALNAKTKRLSRELGNTGIGAHAAGRAVVGLAQSFATGDISATALTSRLTLLGGRLGAIGIGIAVVAGLLALYKRRSDAARDAAIKYGDQLRQVDRAIADLMRPTPKSPFESEVDRITDMMIELRHQIDKAQQSWMGLLRSFVANVGIHVMTPFGPIDIGGTGAKPSPEEKQLAALARRRAALTPEAERQHISDVAARDQRIARSLSRLLQGSEIDQLSDSLERARKELADLINAGLDPMSDQAKSLANGILQGEAALRKMERSANVLRNGLQTLSDTIEDFVVTGTLAFTDFLNNILRLLYRDFTGSIVDSIVRSVTRVPGSGTSGGGGIQTTGSAVTGGAMGSVASTVNFNIQAIDAQGVAQFIQGNGPAIAAEVTRHVSHSAGLRRAYRRG